MKIGILTHPQGPNYGGLLQCYALCAYLKKMGHEPIVIQRVADKSFFLWDIVRSVLKALHFPRYYKPNQVDRMVNIRPFIQKYLVRTEPMDSQRKMRKVCKRYGLEAVIVGSDQVWRTSFAMSYGYNYFLDFVPAGVKKFSYAASFGLSTWDYTPEQTEKIRELLKDFNGISVRESEGVSLIKQHLQMDAVQLIDPTMLLTSEDYSKVSSDRLVEEKYIFVYWLGDKKGIAEEVKKYREQGYTVIENYLRDNIEQVSVEDWLSYIKYAERVITDSFHGFVFSIIFGKKFNVFENASGGSGRIKSLMFLLNITDGCITDSDAFYKGISQLRNDANSFIKSCLN